jgi:hypothetical protein
MTRSSVVAASWDATVKVVAMPAPTDRTTRSVVVTINLANRPIWLQARTESLGLIS